jgi:dienelactone hydrolase
VNVRGRRVGRKAALAVIVSVIVSVLAVPTIGGCGVQMDSASHIARWRMTRPHPAAPTAKSVAVHARPMALAGVSGEYRVGSRLLTFREPADGGPRTLVTELRYPAGGGPFPLLMFAPGFMQCGAPYANLLRTWASAGYVVATVDFPRTDCRVGASADEADLVNQPADMSYVISKLLTLSARPGDPLSGLLNPRQIAAAGQSDGGDTVAALAANACCADHRLTAVAVLSGAEWPPMPGRYFTGRTPPMLFTQGSADTINPPAASVRLYTADRSRERYYLDLFGADHTAPYWGSDPAERLVSRETLAFFDHYVLGQPAPLPPVPAAAGLLVSGSRLPPG